MNWLKLHSLLWTALSILLFGLSAEHGVTQGGFPFFVAPQWNYDGSRIAIVAETTILIHDAASDTLLYRLEGHTDAILDVAWSPVDNRLASASADQTVKVWYGDTGTLLHNLTGHNEPVTQIVWSPDSMRLITSGRENRLSLFMWNAQTGVIESTTAAGTIVDAAFSPNGETLAISYSLDLALLDGQTLEPIIEQPRAMCCSNRMEYLAWNSDGSQIVTGSINGLVTIWDAATLNQVRQFPANDNYVQDSRDVPDLSLSWVRDVAFGADSTIQAVSGDGTLRHWDMAGNLLQETQIGRLDTASWSTYGAQLAVQGGTLSAAALAQSEMLTESRETLQILVPDPSPERLQAIAAQCGAPLTVERGLDAAIASADYADVIAQIDALPAEAIPPACAADLRAVAEAMQGQ